MLDQLQLAVRATRLWAFGPRGSTESDYDAASATYDDYYSLNLASCAQTLLDKLPLRPSMHVLDLACGTGFFTQPIAVGVGQHGKVDAVDLSANMLAVNHKHAEMKGIDSRIRYVKSDALEYIGEQAEDQYDLIVCGWGICYMDHSRFFQESTRCLKPGGVLGIIENRKDSLQESSEIFQSALARHSSALRKHLDIRLPRNHQQLTREAQKACLRVRFSWSGEKPLQYQHAEEVCDYLIKSGASAGFIDSIDAAQLDTLVTTFVDIANGKLAAQQEPLLVHRYSALVAEKPNH